MTFNSSDQHNSIATLDRTEKEGEFLDLKNNIEAIDVDMGEILEQKRGCILIMKNTAMIPKK
jgi:hypothetical protein